MSHPPEHSVREVATAETDAREPTVTSVPRPIDALYHPSGGGVANSGARLRIGARIQPRCGGRIAPMGGSPLVAGTGRSRVATGAGRPRVCGLDDRHAGRESCATCSTNRSEEHTSELQSLMRISYAVFCLKKKQTHTSQQPTR